MPDGDIIHPTLSPRYNNVYNQLCEGVNDEESLARAALQCLKKDVKDFGNAPVELIRQTAQMFEQICVKLSSGLPVDWAEERKRVKVIARQVSGQMNGDKRGIQLAVRACDQHLLQLQKDAFSHASAHDLSLTLAQQYLITIYDSQFAKHVEHTRDYHQTQPLLVQEILLAMRPRVLRGIEDFAGQVIENKVLRLPRRQTKMRKINLNTDLDSDLDDLLGRK